MKQIVAMRHADASYHADDFIRQLTDVGKRSAHKSAQFIKGIKIDKVLCSPSTRTLETLDIIRSHCVILEITVTENLYGASEQDILDIVQTQPDTLTSLLIIGHNPGLHDFCLKVTKKIVAEHFDSRNFMPPSSVISIMFPHIDYWKNVETKKGIICESFIP